MLKGLLFACVLVVAAFGWVTCRGTPLRRDVSFIRPHEFVMDHYLPAGDSTAAVPKILKFTRYWWREYPHAVEIPHDLAEERWTVDSPHVATVRPGGVIYGHTPGWAEATLRLREFTKVRRIRVDPPLDSVVMRWAVREAILGDTVELFLGRYYANGREEGGTTLTSEPEDRDRNGIPLAERVQRTGRSTDTTRFWMRRPGRFHLSSIAHGHVVADTLQIVESSGRAPRLFRAPEWGLPQQPVPGRRPAACYSLSYGSWSDPQSPNSPATRRGYEFLPAAVELDSTLIVNGRPDLGMRINAVGYGRLEMPRSWKVGGDSLLLDFETREHAVPHRYRVRVAIPRLGERVIGKATQSSTIARVEARRLPCA